jgi:hypothetical protein
MVSLRNRATLSARQLWINDARSGRVENPRPRVAAVQPHVQHAAGPNPVAQPAAAVQPGPVLGVPQATWSDVPPELRLQVYDLVGNTFVLKPIPGSKLPGNIVPAFFQALVSDSGLERVNSTLLLELQAQLLTKRLHAAEMAMIIVHWDCVEQLIPLLRMIKSARNAEIAWIQHHGDAPAFGRRQLSIMQPISNYLDRTSERRGQSFINLHHVEQQTLEYFLEMTLSYLASREFHFLHLEILVPRGLTQAHIPANIAGVSLAPAIWQWPDPRTIVSKCRHPVIEAEGLPVWVSPVCEENLPIPVETDYHMT